jgi:8-oxo-dGTP pyrophosphatase MutT (NUDIX family)
MEVDRPGPGEELNPGAATTPRQAASVIVLRGGGESLEVLLVRRTPQARFMGGVWVFPGGAVDEGEDERDAAVRELVEEAAVTVRDRDAMVRFSRWITPAEVKIRFDTHFFLAPLPEGAEPAIDGEEIVDLGWFTPSDALQAYSRGELELVFPTIKHLEPKVITSGDSPRVLLPGEPGYDD